MSEDKTKPPPELVNMVLSQITKEVKQYKADLATANERIWELEKEKAQAYRIVAAAKGNTETAEAERDAALAALRDVLDDEWIVSASWGGMADAEKRDKHIDQAAALLGDGDKAQEGDDEKETG